VTTRGFDAAAIKQVAHALADVVFAPTDDNVLADVSQRMLALCKRYPVYQEGE
jgi:glycine hydroxymethyltransferase